MGEYNIQIKANYWNMQSFVVVDTT